MVTRDILAKSLNGERINENECLQLLKYNDILELGEVANELRFRHNPENYVTFVIDTNPNYSNVCEIDCTFCAFYRHRDDPDSYTYSVDELIKKFKDAARRGVTTVLLQGGVHPDLPFEYYLELVERTRKEVPEIHPHFFSTSEIIGMSKISGLSIREVLMKLKEVGLNTLPGGGAEILSDRVKRKISKKKGTSADWLNVMREAHLLGYKTTATMMYGHIETDEDIVIHLESLRKLQDETKGFTAFIPWSFKPENTPLEKHIKSFASPYRYLQIIAIARIYLDNFPHIQASWFSEGKKIGQVALHFGADDFGGTLEEEYVHAAANFINKSSKDEVIDLIHGSGFDAAQRDTLYNIVKVYKIEEIEKES